MENFNKELKSICGKSKYLSYKDTVENNGYDKTIIIIKISKDSDRIIYFSELQDLSEKHNKRVVLYLIYLDGKKSDDFSWVSMEKYKKVKLFENAIIDPLSKKFKRIEE